MKPPGNLRKRFQQALTDEQLRDLERLWYQAGDDRSQFARQLVQLVERLGDKYQVDELAAKYEFTGRTPMTVPQALEIKEELETIDRLLKQLEEAAKTAQIGIIDLEELSQFAEPGDIEKLNQLQKQIEDYLREMAEQQGLEQRAKGFQLDAQGLSPVSGQAAGADLQQPGSLAHRPAPGPDRRRRGRRAAADQALRVRRLGRQHGHPGLADQRHAPRRPRPADPAQAGGHRDPPHAQHAQVRHRAC